MAPKGLKRELEIQRTTFKKCHCALKCSLVQAQGKVVWRRYGQARNVVKRRSLRKTTRPSRGHIRLAVEDPKS